MPIFLSTPFFGDFNLFGMGIIKIKKYSFREEIKNTNNDMDYNNNYMYYKNNIKWENERNNLNKIEKEEIKEFIQGYNEFMIWDSKYIDIMNMNKDYNNFAKSSNNVIEIYCTISNIIKGEIKEEEQDDINIDINKEVSMSNLKMYIKNCKSLINLCK